MTSTPAKQAHLSLVKKNSLTGQDQLNNMVVLERRCSSQPGTVGWSERCNLVHCRGEAVMICHATTLVSSCALSEAYIGESPCRLADRSSGPVARTRCGWYSLHRRTWSTWFWLLTLSVSFSSPSMTALVLDSGIIFKNPCLITRDSHRASLVPFENACRCPDPRACYTSSDHHSATSYLYCEDFLHAQIFHVSLLNTCPFFRFNWFAIIWTDNRRSPHTTYLTCSTLNSVLLVEGLPLLE